VSSTRPAPRWRFIDRHPYRVRELVPFRLRHGPFTHQARRCAPAGPCPSCSRPSARERSVGRLAQTVAPPHQQQSKTSCHRRSITAISTVLGIGCAHVACNKTTMQSIAGACGASPAPVCGYPRAAPRSVVAEGRCRFVRRNRRAPRTRLRRFMINCSSSTAPPVASNDPCMHLRGEHEIILLASCRSCCV
jgi:hypothetical protein